MFLGRKNGRFAEDRNGADVSAMLFSLVETAKARDRAPSLSEIPLRTLPRSADHGRHEDAHAATREQIPSPKPPQAQAAQKVKTLASIADQARSWKMRTTERLPISTRLGQGQGHQPLTTVLPPVCCSP